MDADAVCCSCLPLRNTRIPCLMCVCSQARRVVDCMGGLLGAAAAATEASEGADTYDMVIDGMNAAMAMLGGGAGAPAAAQAKQAAGLSAVERRLAAKREKLLQQVQVDIIVAKGDSGTRSNSNALWAATDISWRAALPPTRLDLGHCCRFRRR
jgi:hypothetical protein